MDEEKNISEKAVEVNVNAISTDTEIKEDTQTTYIQAASTPDVAIQDAEIIDIQMEEAFPFIASGALNEAMDDKDVLIDGRTVEADNEDFVRLEDLLDITAESGTKAHSLLHGRELSDQHPITAISGLRDELDEIESIKRVYSSENGLGEFRKWNDDNPKGEDRSGYFVTIVPGTDNVEICDSTHDVYGISVKNSGFVGNQNELDKSDDWTYTMVGIVGTMRVRTDGTARNGEYVVPNAYGEATLSENNYGYKVLSQGSYPSYNYVTIAITPQSDALSRIEGSLSGSQADISQILIELNITKDKADEALDKSQIAIDTSLSNEELMEILGETVNDAKRQATTANDVATAAQTAADQAKSNAAQALSTAQKAYSDAQTVAKEAVDTANSALAEVSDLKDDMTALSEWSNGENYGITGFVSQANEDHTTLATLVAGFGPDGSDIAAIMQKIDKNGAVIQHLVAHVDRYAVGEYSLSYGLTHDEAMSILQDTYVYVPTVTHSETMSDVTTDFERGYAYTWNNVYGIWEQSAEPVSTSTSYKDGSNGDLWYVWQDVEQLDDEGKVVTTYLPGTLYEWIDNMWAAVATVSDNYQGRVLTSVKQTADTIESSVINSKAEGSTLRQKLDSIFTTVYNSDGYISSLEQTANSIRAGTYTPDGTASQLELLTSETTSSLNAVASGRFHVVYQSYLGTAPEPLDGKKYTSPPAWNDVDEIFIFNESLIDENGIYYFISADKTKYCKVTEDGYEIYTIGNKATSAYNSRINTTEAILAGTALLDTENTSMLSNITIAAKEEGSDISSVASYYYHSMISVSEEKVPVVEGGYKYKTAPVWNLGLQKYVFGDAVRAEDTDTIVYYFVDADEKTYCKAITLEDGTVLYEMYGISDLTTASILQRANANEAAIGLVVDKDGIKGSVILSVINDESLAKINADRIDLLASKSFSAIVGTDGTITPASIVMAINSDNTSSTEIKADKIDLAASTKFSAIVGDGNVVTPAKIIGSINDDTSSLQIAANKVNITADDIDFKASKTFSVIVGDDGVVDPDKIITAINASDSSVVISADHLDFSGVSVDLSGYVTFHDLRGSGTTTINGDNITTGTIDASQATITNIDADNITSGTISAIDIYASRFMSILESGASESTGNVEFYYLNTNNLAGGIMLDDNGAGTDWESQYRMFIYTNTVGGEAFSLKLLSAGSMSLESNRSIYAYASDYMTFELGSSGTNNNITIYYPYFKDKDGNDWWFGDENLYMNGSKWNAGNIAVFG